LLISTLEIESPRLSSRINTNRQDSNQVLDSNLMTQLDAISLDKNEAFAKDFYDENENFKTMSDYCVVRDDLDYYNLEKSFHDPKSLAHIIIPLDLVY